MPSPMNDTSLQRWLASSVRGALVLIAGYFTSTCGRIYHDGATGAVNWEGKDVGATDPIPD